MALELELSFTYCVKQCLFKDWEISFSDYSVVRMKAIKESIMSERYLAELIVITIRRSCQYTLSMETSRYVRR
jgi:hypothetical protein